MERSPRSPRPLAALVAAVGLAFAATQPVRAAAPIAPTTCAPAPADPAVTLTAVSDDGDLTLADGRVIRLAGLDLARPSETAPERPAAVRAALLAWALRPLTLRPLSATPDRWGRIPALLFRADAPEDAGAALLTEGLARVAPERITHVCTAERFDAEERARAEKRGIWADPAAAVLAPGDAAGLAAQAGGLALVQGILHVHESRGALYLALGRDRRGFAAMVSRRDAKMFARVGMDLKDYEGTPVRLRGDLDARFGPRMRLTDPDALESLEPGSIVEEDGRPDTPAKHWTVPPDPR